MNNSEIKNRLLTEEHHDFKSLCLLVSLLRSEDGCPWDRVQTHTSIRKDFIEETYEAGIVLTGTEIKSVRQGKVSIKESYARIRDGEMMLYGMNISPYEQGNIFNRDPMRVRRLLMHKREIMRLFGRVKQDGYALIPLSVYFRGSLVKVEVALARGKKLYDKREDAAKKDAKRQIDRAMKGR